MPPLPARALRVPEASEEDVKAGRRAFRQRAQDVRGQVRKLPPLDDRQGVQQDEVEVITHSEQGAEGANRGHTLFPVFEPEQLYLVWAQVSIEGRKFPQVDAPRLRQQDGPDKLRSRLRETFDGVIPLPQLRPPSLHQPGAQADWEIDFELPPKILLTEKVRPANLVATIHLLECGLF